MPKLSDTQSILLSAAADREDGALLPPPEGVKARGAALDRSLAVLLRLGLAEERPMQSAVLGEEPAPIHITDAGFRAIGLEPVPVGAAASDAAPLARPGGKLGLLLQMTGGEEGATLAELAAAADWLPHTTRAALTRLRQRGFDIQLVATDDRKAYRLQDAA